MVSKVVQDLKKRKSAIAAQIKTLENESSRIEQAIAALSATDGKAPKAVKVKVRRARKFTPEGLARIRAAQKKRWAKVKKQQQAAKA
jgi:hypothetical protein